MQFHHIHSKTKFRSGQRIGRGGKRGTTSGRGTKGQKARAGHKIRPALRDIIKKLPKSRGYKFKSFQIKPTIISIATLNEHFKEGEMVSPKTLVARGLLDTIKGHMPKVKVLGGSEMKKKLIFKDVLFSRPARVRAK